MELLDLELRIRDTLAHQAAKVAVSRRAWAGGRARSRRRSWRPRLLVPVFLLLAVAVMVPLTRAFLPAVASNRVAPAVAGTTMVDPAARLRAAGVSVEGSPVAGVEWSDANGRNLLVLSVKERRGRPLDGDETLSTFLFADHFVTADGATRLVWDARDERLECWGEHQTAFRPGSLGVTDLDRDGVGEATFAYLMGCRTDDSEDEFRLVLVEDGREHVVRGQSYDHPRRPYMAPLADGTPEPGWDAWPAPFRTHVRALYDRWVNR